MNLQRSLLLVAGLSLTACASSPNRTNTEDASVPNAPLTVHVVEASGGA